MQKKIFIAIIILVVGFIASWKHTSLSSSSISTPIPTIATSTPPHSNNIATSTDYTITPWITNLEVPWSLIWTSSDRAIVSERPGRIREIINGKLQEKPLIQFPEVSSTSEEGLMGLVIDPQYQNNFYIYACMAYLKNGQITDKLIRFRDPISMSATIPKPPQEILLDDIPAAKNHAGCRLSFGPDDKLYVSTGDATNKQLAQDLGSLAGKILRLNPDGSIPDDNPFQKSPIYSYGHRNPQGLTWHPITNELWSSEHGPSGNDGPLGGDEINRILPGQNYGWPIVSHDRNQPGLIAPIVTFTPAIAPGSAMFYKEIKLPQFTNKLFISGLRGNNITIITINDDNQTLKNYEALDLQGIPTGRIRDITTGPDGYIYFTSSNKDGRGKPNPNDDTIYVIKPTLDQ